MTTLKPNEAVAPVKPAQAAPEIIANSWSSIAVVQTGAVLHVTLNRPDARNAMSLQMVAELRQVLAQAEARAGQADAVRVVVLRGAGGHFCAGADLKDMAGARMRSMQREAGAPDPIAEVNAEFGRLCVAYAETLLAVVAVLEGTVMGGGFGLACVADVAMASDTANFRLPETSLGVVPAQIAPFLVERLGYSQAKRLAVTGGRLDASAALALGLVHDVTSTDGLQVALNKVLADILACAPSALAATKALMQRARFAPAADLVQDAAAIFAQSAQSAEGLEGMTAFIQKRKPNWTLT
jgi:isohexenylglutaconyl-CoA hydratase